MSLIIVAWYVLKAKNRHSVSQSDPLGPWGEAKLSYLYCVNRHGKVKPSILRQYAWQSQAKYIKTYFSFSTHPQAVACVSTPRMYPRSGYFLVSLKNILMPLFWIPNNVHGHWIKCVILVTFVIYCPICWKWFGKTIYCMPKPKKMADLFAIT